MPERLDRSHVVPLETVGERLTAIERDVSWIRAMLADARIVERLEALERSSARTQAGLAVALSIVTLGLTAAKAAGLIH